ncbi:hypothetical protein AM493_01085 [Flavobacterium akiainvivens]|uniref:Uncharacterized protein n=1 Tax=Flavobacterium akiainvivens TaxID=1202724 RepID=A0A0M9VGS4_9FLAO|nr:hypothetical protein [Flavobacterium akiainvivens]KOS04792.1 hypothetical protein AM493_01085 [Flavobacterium akiainvivens]SFQ66219.1 hypothetical protein SAMN05444144_1134 [Flavobacterium akiainvivens]
MNQWFIDILPGEIRWGNSNEDSELPSPSVQFFDNEDDFALALREYPDEFVKYQATGGQAL